MSSRTVAVTNPATDEIVGRAPLASPEDVGRAIDAADEAFSAWRRQPAVERAVVLRAWADRVDADCDELARLLTAEQGKPMREARSEVSNAAIYIRDAAEWATRIEGAIVPNPSLKKRTLVLHEPVGIVAAVTPWNFPVAIAARKVAPALAAGCAVLLKPSTLTPLTSLALATRANEAGLPSGALSVLVGPGNEVVSTCMADPRVRLVTFTGSTEVGRGLARNAARHLTRLSLELGGHAPFIVFEDANVERAVEGAIASKFRNAGQTCLCPNRLVVQRSIAPRFLEVLVDQVKQLRVGRGDDERVDIGPLIDDRAIQKVEAHVDGAVHGGARIEAGGSREQVEGLADRFFQPTILVGLPPDALINREETFGPVLPVDTFDSEDEAVHRANDTPYGLAAYFYTENASRLVRVSEALNFGIVGANDGAPSQPFAPLGGRKESGYGREGGRWGVHEFLETKYVSIGLG